MDVQMLLLEGVMFLVPGSLAQLPGKPQVGAADADQANAGTSSAMGHSDSDAINTLEKMRATSDTSSSSARQHPTPSHYQSLELAATAFNAGSAGHPHFCRRPCNFQGKGACERGTQCGFCHCHHDDGQPMHLDKPKKCLLRAMSLADREALLAHVLHQGVDKMNVGPEVAQLVQDWCSAVGEIVQLEAFELPKLPGVKPSDMRKLLGILSRMNLSIVSGIARSTCGDSKIVEATDRLLEALRAHAAA